MRSALTVVLVAVVIPPLDAASYELYTLSSVLPFEATIPGNGSVVKGSIRAATLADVARWDLSGTGQDPNAAPGTHACADLGFNPFASCPFFIEGAGDQAEAFVFRLTLDAASGPVSACGPHFSLLPQTAFGGSAYIISGNAADRVPVSSSTGSFQFHTSNAPQVFIQPGESTVWLLSRYEPGELAAALASGVTLRMDLVDNSVLTGVQFTSTPQVGWREVGDGSTTTTLPSNGACADPVAPHAARQADSRQRSVIALVTASDALAVLAAAVGTTACEICVCDVDGSGSISATDALATLLAAVGLPVELACPPCD